MTQARFRGLESRAMDLRIEGSKSPFDAEKTEAIVRQVKAELRRRMRSLRGALAAETRAERSREVVERLAALEVIECAQTVGLYAPMVERGELDIEPLHERLSAQRKVIAYPRMLEDRSLVFHQVEELESLEERGNLFREPLADPSTRIVELDVLVIPALAADSLGNRLGYGGGSYDRALAGFARRPTTIAVVYDFQVLVEVPRLATDEPVDLVLTDRRVFRRSG